jgi:hypothetical protein
MSVSVNPATERHFRNGSKTETMEGVWQFLQGYGPWLLLTAGLLIFTRRNGGIGCCGSSCRTDAASRDPAQAPVDREMVAPAGRPPTTKELRAQLAELQTKQERLARDIASLSAEPATTSVRPRDVGVTAAGGWAEGARHRDEETGMVQVGQSEGAAK